MVTDTSQDAMTVASALLETTGDALNSGDFDAFAACFKLPQTLSTMDGVRHLQTRDDMYRTFREVRAHYAALGLDRLDRWVEAALFDGSGVIRSAHVTHMLSATGQLLKPPFVSLSRLELHDGLWLISGNHYTVSAETDHGKALMSGGSLTAPDTPPKSTAEAVVQAHLDAVNRAYLSEDIDGLCASVQLPLFVQASRETQVFSSLDTLVPEFKRHCTQFKVHSVTDVVRTVTHAEMLGQRRIQATYRSHVLSGALLIIPAYKSTMTLQQGEDLNWRVTSIIHPMEHMTLEVKAEAEANNRGLRRRKS